MDIHVETYMCRPKGLELFGSRDVEKVCECSFLFADCGTSAISQWLGASVMTNFGGVDVVPLLCTCNGTQKKHPEKLP